MKVYLLILLFLCFVVVGVIVYLRYYFKFKLFKDMVFLCKSLKNNISFNKNNISKILSEKIDKVSYVTRYILNNQKTSKLILVGLNDVEQVYEFFDSLGSGDVTFEISNIDYYEKAFEEKRLVSTDRLNKEGKMYLKLIIGIGLALCIILI